jgi:PAS domain S-box-containing protein
MGRYISSSLDLGEVLELVMNSLIDVTGAERGMIMLWDTAQSELQVQVVRNLDRATIESPAFEVSRNIVQRVLDQGTPLLVNDALNDPGLQQFRSVVALRLRSILCAPLRVKDRTIGVVYIDNRLRSALFGQADLELVEAFADQAAIAIENARLYEGVQERLREITDLVAYQESVLRSVGNGVIAVDSAGRITTFNAAAETILGLSAAEVLGADFREALGPDIGQFIYSYLAGLQPLEAPTRASHDITCEVPQRGRVYLSGHVSSLRTPEGRTAGLVIAIEDETEKRQLEQARRAEEDKRRLLGRFFAPAVLEEILRNPEAAARLAGVRKELTVFFADIRGYTTLSEPMAPEELVAMLNGYLELASQAIHACAGAVDKYVGDAVMALFNAPTDQPAHAVYAVWAALALQGSSGRWRMATGRQVEFGIGVNTGEAIAGYIGATTQPSYTAIGDAVNVAARLQAGAQPGEVLIGEATHARVQTVFQTECLGPTEVKGRIAPVVVYRVLGPRIPPVNEQTGPHWPKTAYCPICGTSPIGAKSGCPHCRPFVHRDPAYLLLADGARFPLVEETVILGRHSRNDLVLPDSSVSRHHARLLRLPHGWLVMDLKSTNGTRVNGDAATVYLLRDGDTIALGDVEINFRTVAAPSHVTRRRPTSAVIPVLE